MADTYNGSFKKIATATNTTTLLLDASGVGAGVINYPQSVAVDSVGNVYASDLFQDHVLYKVSTTGATTLLAGIFYQSPNPPNAHVDGTGLQATFSGGEQVSVDLNGNVLIADTGNNLIRSVDSESGVVSTIAGSGGAGLIDGLGNESLFNQPIGIAVDKFGNSYVADRSNAVIRKITSTGIVTTVSTPKLGYLVYDVAVDLGGNVYIADTYNNEIEKLTPSGLFSVIAGSGTGGYLDNPNGLLAEFNLPEGITVDSNSGTIYVADTFNQCIRVLTPSSASTYSVSTLPGAARGSMQLPVGVAVDANADVFVADQSGNQVYEISSGSKSTIAGSTQGIAGFVDGVGTDSLLSGPLHLVFDPSGNLFVTDNRNSAIRQLKQQGPGSWVVTTIAGGPTAPFFAVGNLSGGVFDVGQPDGIAISPPDATGNWNLIFTMSAQNAIGSIINANQYVR